MDQCGPVHSHQMGGAQKCSLTVEKAEDLALLVTVDGFMVVMLKSDTGLSDQGKINIPGSR